MGQQRTGGVFLSYRRHETEHAAGRLADRIAERFGPAQVFMDIDSIPPGADFVEAITEAVGGCDVLLALIGPQWTTLVDDQGHRRLDDPEDFVVREVQAALERRIRVIPVLVDGATMPRRSELPPSLAGLATRNAMRLDAETFRSDSGAVLDAIAQTLPPPAGPAAPARRKEPAAARTAPSPDSAGHGGRMDRRTVLRLGIAGAVTVLAGGAAAVLANLGGPGSGRDAERPAGPRWVYETGDQVFSSPVVASGVLYIGSNDGAVYALDAATGERRWRYATAGAVTSTPAVAGQLLVVGCNDQKVHAVDAATGGPRWTFGTGAAMHSSPAVDGDTVYIGCRDHNLYAIDLATGAERWRFPAGDWFNSSPTVAEGVVYVGCRDTNVYAVDAGTGTQRWRYTTRSSVDSSPLVEGGSVWIGGDDHTLYALSAADGSWIWDFDAQGGIVSTPVVSDGVLYVGSDDTNLYAIDASTGRMRWTCPTGNGIRSSPAVADGLVYVGSRDRSLYAVDALTGEPRWSFATQGPIDDSSPAVVGDLVYVGSLDHRVYALDRRSGGEA